MELSIENFLEEFKRDTINYVEKAQYNFQDTTEEEIRRFISKMINNLEMERYRLPYIEEFLNDHLYYLKTNAQNKTFENILETVLLSNRTLQNNIRNSYQEKDEIEKQAQFDRSINNFARNIEFPNELWIENYCEELRSDLIRKYNMHEDYDLMTLVRRTITNFSDELMQGYQISTIALNREIEQKLGELNQYIHNEVKEETKENPIEDNKGKFNDLATMTPEELVNVKYNEMSNVLNDQTLTKEQQDKLCDEISNKYDTQINATRDKQESKRYLESLFL